LRVTSSNDFRVGTFCGCEVEEALGLAVGSGRGAFGKNVSAKGGIIWASNTLAGDIIGAVGSLQAPASRWANARTLCIKIMSVGEAYIDWQYWHAYNVAIFSGSAGEDERDRTASAASKLVDSRSNRLSALDVGGEGDNSAGEESNGGSELHVCR
jgi:hypothetical protein